MALPRWQVEGDNNRGGEEAAVAAADSGTVARHATLGGASTMRSSMLPTTRTLALSMATASAASASSGTSNYSSNPASSFSHTRWYDLHQPTVTGDELRSPRVRIGPVLPGDRGYADPEADLFRDKGADRRKTPGPRSRERMRFENKQTNWENATDMNLSYQTLGDAFQRKQFVAVIRRLIRCERLQLMENELTTLRGVTLNKCTELNISRNLFSSLKELPNCPRLAELDASWNNISTLAGLRGHRSLRSLTLTGNPVCFKDAYRQHVFRILPKLVTLDGLPKQPEDSIMPAALDASGSSSDSDDDDDEAIAPSACTVL